MLVILAVCVVAGVVAAGVWALLAPPARYVITDQGQALLPGDNLHLFDSLAIFVGVTAVAGAICGAAVWVMRRRRGPAAVLMLVGGSGLGSGIAALLGGALAELRVPDPFDDSGVAIVSLPPEVTAWQALIFQPLVAVFVYFIAAGVSSDPDLGVSGGRSPGGTQGGELIGDPVPGVGESVYRGGTPTGTP
ncbi:DUF2567 domain-containing protein [Hoyosella altamirensis]|uniref:DUF2567 domain-containing protein n=1 Tax=Hoyosella altamirensis TaxID=616997 RepID=A0A839RQE4_9ACTN|nr:DUF2567 domain-containing protein [Hoyosella altamirensis]MBB3038760.1 hypothetical protein [Hoyosella altamirensis]